MSIRIAALCLIFVMLWSSGWIFSQYAVDGLSTLTVLSVRYLVMFGVLLIVVTLMGHWRKLSNETIVLHLVVGALSHAIHLIAGVGAFELGVSASVVAFITALQPMLSAVLAGPLIQELTTHRQWQGLFIGLFAVMVLMSDSYSSGVASIALVLPLVSVLALSIATIINRKLELNRQVKQVKPTPITFVLLLHSMGALIVLLPLNLPQNHLRFDLSGEQWIAILWLALVVSLGAFGVLLILLRHLSSMQVASLAYLVPPATMLQAYFVFNDRLEATEIFALAVASIGVYLVLSPIPKQPRFRRYSQSTISMQPRHHNANLLLSKQVIAARVRGHRVLDIEL